jgi:Flp pilus assembly pilin Flp
MSLVERALLTALVAAVIAFGAWRLGTAARDAFCRASAGVGNGVARCEPAVTGG